MKNRLTEADRKNLHGAIDAAFHSVRDEEPFEIMDLIDMIERRFGVASVTVGMLTTREQVGQLLRELESVLPHIQSHPEWSQQRLQYAVDQTVQRRRS